jgi:hypothetical protein
MSTKIVIAAVSLAIVSSLVGCAPSTTPMNGFPVAKIFPSPEGVKLVGPGPDRTEGNPGDANTANEE